MSCLPEAITPECWNDEKRLSVLFAPIRPRSVNPQDWDSKYNFWKNLISAYCSYCKKYSFKISDLQNAFKNNGRVPSCLEIVIEQMVKNGECVLKKTFLQATPDTWGKWVADTFVKKPILWSFNSIKNSLITQSRDNVYVHLDAVRKDADELLASMNDYKNKVINLEELLTLRNCDIDNINNFKLLIHYLVTQHKASIKILNGSVHNDTENNLKQFLIKFGDKNVPAITDIEVGIHTLEQNEKALLKNVETLENEICKVREDAKLHLMNNRRQIAKSCLRKKHELEKHLTKRANALYNVQTLLARVHNASTEAQVLESYKLALSSLRDTFKNAGLSEESVSETMLELGEVLEIHDDIQTSLSQPIIGESDTDIEEELAELCAAEKSNAATETPLVDTNMEDLEKRLRELSVPDAPKSHNQQAAVLL